MTSTNNRRAYATQLEAAGRIGDAMAHGDHSGAAIAAHGAGWRIDAIRSLVGDVYADAALAAPVAGRISRREARRMVRLWDLAAVAAAA
jgi:hypothetical protein